MNMSRTHTQSQHANWTKTLLYYTAHIGVAGSIAFLVTGSWWIALAVSVIEPAVQVLAWLMQCWEQRWEQHWEQRTQSHLLQQTQCNRGGPTARDGIRHRQRHADVHHIIGRCFRQRAGIAGIK